MRKLFSLLVLSTFLIITISAQSFEVEWEVEGELWPIGDLNGDGAFEFVRYNENDSTSYIYSSKTKSVLYTVHGSVKSPRYDTFELNSDFNSNGVIDITSDYYQGTTYASFIIDPSTNEEIFESPGNIYGPKDYDNDGVLEIITNYDNRDWPNPIYYFEMWSTGISVTGVSTQHNDELKKSITLQQNYPNPFNPTTTIEYEISSTGTVEIKIFNMLGEELFLKSFANQAPGNYRFEWDGRNSFGEQVSSGRYIYQVSNGKTNLAKKMILMK